jgi:hypothetical protein
MLSKLSSSLCLAALGSGGAPAAAAVCTAIRNLTTGTDLLAVLKEKIPVEQVGASYVVSTMCPVPATYRLQHVLQARLKSLKKEHGSKVLGETTVDMAIGGMRGIPVRDLASCGASRASTSSVFQCRVSYGRHHCSMLMRAFASEATAFPTSRHVPACFNSTRSASACTGSRLQRLQDSLPTAKPHGEPLPEGLLWLLLTGDVSILQFLQHVLGALLTQRLR